MGNCWAAALAWKALVWTAGFEAQAGRGQLALRDLLLDELEDFVVTQRLLAPTAVHFAFLLTLDGLYNVPK